MFGSSLRQAADTYDLVCTGGSVRDIIYSLIVARRIDDESVIGARTRMEPRTPM